MRRNFFAGLVLLSSLALMTNCGGGKKHKSSGSSTDSGGTSSSGGSGGGGGSGGDGGRTSGSGGTGGDGTSNGSGGASSGSGGSGTGGGAGEGGAAGEANADTGGTGGTGATGGTGGSGGTGGTPSSCPEQIADFTASIAEAICMKRSECCEDDVEACITEVSDVLDGIFPDLETAEGDETAQMDCDSFDQCAAAIAATSCDDWPMQTGDLGAIPVNEAACHAIIAGQLAADDECTYNYECDGGYCSGDSGMCVAYIEDDASCADDLCDPRTSFCNDAEVCQSLLGNGEDCSANSECQSRVCDTEDTGTCVAPGPDECSWVPDSDTPATCSVQHGPGNSAPSGVPVALAMLGMGLGVVRRRRALRQ